MASLGYNELNPGNAFLRLMISVEVPFVCQGLMSGFILRITLSKPDAINWIWGRVYVCAITTNYAILNEGCNAILKRSRPLAYILRCITCCRAVAVAVQSNRITEEWLLMLLYGHCQNKFTLNLKPVTFQKLKSNLKSKWYGTSCSVDRYISSWQQRWRFSNSNACLALNIVVFR